MVDSKRLNVFRKTLKVMLIIREPYKEFYYWCQLIRFIMKKKKKNMVCANKEESVSTYGVLWCVPQADIGYPNFVSTGRPFQSRNEFEAKAVSSMATSLVLLMSGVA
jgi:hypothetical protein